MFHCYVIEEGSGYFVHNFKIFNLKFISRGGDIGRANFDAFYIFTIEFSKSPARNFQTFQSVIIFWSFGST
jgi:hypothetical protein